MKDKFYVVAIGASSGGLEILKEVLSQLPAKNNAAFIILQHLHKDYVSTSAEILSAYTSMPVYRAHENQLIEARSVYVLPENQMMTVRDGRLHLIERTPKQLINEAINIFFESLGEDLKERAIGIVLTGNGSDGTAGSAFIHANGGLVMVQKPGTAEYPDMPQSMVTDGHPDFVMPVSLLVKTLVEFINK